jgi:hypothetical protein
MEPAVRQPEVSRNGEVISGGGEVVRHPLAVLGNYKEVLMGRFLVALAALTAVTIGLAFAADVGPKADVAAVRALEKQSYTKENFDVHVVGDYALVQWGGIQEGTGTHAYKRISGERWTKIGVFPETGLTTSYLVQRGVPTTVARQLCASYATPQYPKNSPCMDYTPKHG